MVVASPYFCATSEVAQKYGDATTTSAAYLFEVQTLSTQETQYIDGERSGHPSRCINHAEASRANLMAQAAATVKGSDIEPAIEFYATRDIAAGEELTFDYGVEYWVRQGVTPLDDSRGAEIALRRASARVSTFVQLLRWGLPL